MQVIVFSAVRANHGGHVGFLADWCRTNVAVTRARNGLIVIGNEVSVAVTLDLQPCVCVLVCLFVCLCVCVCVCVVISTLGTLL